MGNIVSSLLSSDEVEVFLVVVAALAIAIIADRVAQGVNLWLALYSIRRWKTRNSMVERLMLCLSPLPTADPSAPTLLDLDAVGRLLQVREPEIYTRWWRCDGDVALQLLVNIPPMLGILLTLLAISRGATRALTGAAVMPTVLGVAFSVIGACFAAAIRRFDFPTRLAVAVYGQASGTSETPMRKSRSVKLHSQAAPTLCLAFFVCYADLLTGIIVRDRSENGGVIRALEDVEDSQRTARSEEGPYLETTAGRGGATLQGVALPGDVRERGVVIREQVTRRLLMDRPPPVVVVLLRTDGVPSCGDVLLLKMQIQREMLAQLGKGHVLQFSEELVSPARAE